MWQSARAELSRARSPITGALVFADVVVQGYEGLYVVDGTMAPSGCTAATNPAHTIATSAERCVENILSCDF